MLTAWGFGSAFGPLLVAYMRQASGNYRGALHAMHSGIFDAGSHCGVPAFANQAL
jgi:hypothetical protein